MITRPEAATDAPAIYQVNAAAFKTTAEAELVDRLRREVDPFVSIVADEDSHVVGHILFTPVSLSGHPDRKIMGLGPMAVAPDHQGQGIGSALVRAGLEACRELGYAGVIVLGHPEFYPRFGFVPSTRYGIRWERNVREEVFMALELEPGALQGATGIIRYHEAFDSV